MVTSLVPLVGAHNLLHGAGQGNFTMVNPDGFVAQLGEEFVGVAGENE